MKITVQNPMTQLIVAAAEGIRQHYNALAADNLHDDILAMAKGEHCSIHSRHAEKEKILAKLNTAETPTELEQMLAAALVISQS